MKRRSIHAYGLPLLAALCIVRLWLMPLPSSFWVDEMATSFVVHHGANDPTLRVAPQVPMSIYYALPRVAEKLLGSSEIAYRLPSLLAMAVALWLIWRIAAKLIHPNAGWFAVFACLALRGFNYQAADARPYALGTCILCIGAWLLIQWMDSNRWRDAILFAVCAAMLWRVSLVFWPFYAVFAMYAIVRVTRRETEVTWVRAGATFGLLAALLAPVVIDAILMVRTAHAHVISPMPRVPDLVAALKFGLLAVCGVGAAILSRWLRLPANKPPAWSPLALIAAWWLCAPLGLFGFSRLTGTVTFVPRYLSPGLPGAALAATAAAALFVPPRHWKTISLGLGAGVLLLLGQWKQPWPPHQNSNWRGAAISLNAQELKENTPVICPSPFIEAKFPVWRADYPIDSFLYSQLLVYQVAGKKYPFPFEDSRQAETQARALIHGVLPAAGRFAIYGPDASVRYWRDWFRSRPELALWRSRDLGSFGDVEAVMFEKPEQIPR